MSTNELSKLYVFAKDTDAPEAIKGFKFQELKTLELWLFNKVHGIEENIYCDFEEDIFHRDLNSFKSTFKQLKLYSSKNFSFSSEEVIKALSHFFMLFVKNEYLLDETTFIFETNTSIAAKRLDNDAELLRKWSLNQDNLSDDLLEECRNKLKDIITPYIEEQYLKLSKKEVNDELVLAKDIFKTLSDEIWDNFVRSIKWSFEGISSEEAINNSVDNSMKLISQLPFPLSNDEHSLVFDRLRGIVGDKSMQTEPQYRLLTNELLDIQLLGLGDKDDKIYLESYEIWKDIDEIQFFNIGEFYQVLFAVKHCRRNDYLKEHTNLWLKLLSKYYNNSDTLRKQKRESIYEFIWLILRPSTKSVPSTSLKGLESIIYDYFSDFEILIDMRSVEDALNLLTVIATCQRLQLIDIKEEEVLDWFNKYDSLIEELKLSTVDKNFYCNLLELQGFSTLNKSMLGIDSENLLNPIKCFSEIIEELPNANYYSISQLGKRIDEVVKLSIRFDIEEAFIDLEEFSEKILALVQNHEGSFSAAKRYSEKGFEYLKSNNPNGILKALNYFHKAKDLYYNEATSEGYILAILSISQLYSVLGMNLAAKYYSMGAIWFCFQKEDPSLYKRISDSFSLLLHYDFKQGSWISFLQTFQFYLNVRLEFDNNEMNIESDELLRDTLAECAFVMALSSKISIQLTEFINYEKLKMGEFYEDWLEDSLETIKEVSQSMGIHTLVSNKLDSSPINDIGVVRIVTWNFLNNNWNVLFNNDYDLNSIGEEFIAFIQIIQTEITLSNIDFELVNGEFTIKVEYNEIFERPILANSGSSKLWKVFIPKLDSRDSKKINEFYAYLNTSFRYILRNISQLSIADFDNKYLNLFKNKLADKTLVVNAYQKIYRDLVSEDKFNESMRSKFTSELLRIE